jgi:hypothetical protein
MQNATFDEISKSLDDYHEQQIRASVVLTEVEQNTLDYSDALKELNKNIVEGNIPLEKAITLREKLATSNKLVSQSMQKTEFTELSEGLDEYRKQHVRATRVLTKVEQNTLDYSDALKELNKNIVEGNIPLEKAILLRNKLAATNELIIKSMEDAKLDEFVANIASSMETSITDMIMTIGQGVTSLKDLVKGMARLILAEFVKITVARPAANFLASAVGSMVGGLFGGGGGSSGGTVGNKFSGNTASWAGGGYTGNNPRSGGIDGQGGFPAILHPQETVIDHTKNNANQGTVQKVEVNFNITANDTQGFSDLLESRRGMIISMINEAMNDMGVIGVTG